MIKTDQLNRALPIIQPAVSGRTMPILGMVKIDASKDVIKITACNTEMQIETQCAGSSTENESFCVDADKIGRFAKAASGAMVDIKIKDGHADLKAKSKSKLGIMPSDQFPSMDLDLNKSVKVGISALNLSGAIGAVIYAAADNDPSRPYLNGVLFRVKDGKLSLISSDGYRMAKFSIEASGDDIDCIIPKKTALTISKTFKSGDIDIYMGRSSMSISDGVTKITGKCIDAKFPDFSRVTDVETNSIDVDVSAMASDVECSMLTASGNGRIDVNISANSINLSSTNELGESSSASSECVFSGSIDIPVNGRYLDDAVKKLSGAAKMDIPIGAARFLSFTGVDGDYHLVMSLK